MYASKQTLEGIPSAKIVAFPQMPTCIDCSNFIRVNKMDKVFLLIWSDYRTELYKCISRSKESSSVLLINIALLKENRI